MHPTIQKFHDLVLAKDHDGVPALMAEDVRFKPPTYWATWNGRDAVYAVLGHVNEVFENFVYRRVMGEGQDWALEFQCTVEGLDCVGVDLITLNDEGPHAGFRGGDAPAQDHRSAARSDEQACGDRSPLSQIPRGVVLSHTRTAYLSQHGPRIDDQCCPDHREGDHPRPTKGFAKDKDRDQKDQCWCDVLQNADRRQPQQLGPVGIEHQRYRGDHTTPHQQPCIAVKAE